MTYVYLERVKFRIAFRIFIKFKPKRVSFTTRTFYDILQNVYTSFYVHQREILSRDYSCCTGLLPKIVFTSHTKETRFDHIRTYVEYSHDSDVVD